MGLGMNGSGLADVAIESIPFGNWSPIVILMVSGFICYFLSNFISNTATAALLMPILAVVCRAMGDKLWCYWWYQHLCLLVLPLLPLLQCACLYLLLQCYCIFYWLNSPERYVKGWSHLWSYIAYYRLWSVVPIG